MQRTLKPSQPTEIKLPDQENQAKNEAAPTTYLLMNKEGFTSHSSKKKEDP